MRRRAYLVAAAIAVALAIVRAAPEHREGLADAVRCAREAAPPAVGEAAQERVGPCRVRRVIDGDTLDVRCDGRSDRVRLLRIDTPERDEPGHREATRALARLVRGREVHLSFERPGRLERGDHGRLLAYVHLDEMNVNVEMVRQGWSRFWTRYGRGRHAREFVAAEREARAERNGLWSERE